MRIVSLAPITRPDDLVPAIVTRAPTPAADCFRNERRDRCAMARTFPEEGDGGYAATNEGSCGRSPPYQRGGGTANRKPRFTGSRRFAEALPATTLLRSVANWDSRI